MIAAEGLEFAEQVQLTEWTEKIHAHKKVLPRAAITLDKHEKMFEKTLFPTHELERSVVHRHRIGASRVVELIGYALALALMLKDTARARSIECIGRRVKKSLEDMEDRKRVMERRLSGELDSIARKRAELDLLEKTAVEKLMKDEKSSQLAAGLALDQILDRDETDDKNDHQSNRGRGNYDSAQFELPYRATASFAAKEIATIQNRPEAKSTKISVPEKSTSGRFHPPEALSVSAVSKSKQNRNYKCTLPS